MNWTLLLFIFFTILIIISWRGWYRCGCWLFIAFLVCTTAVFLQQITDKINIQL